LKLVHAADLHLDSPLRGLERYEGAPVDLMRAATRRALENLVQLCVDEEARLLLIAGDLYDGDWRDYSTGLFFAHQMRKLEQAGIRVALVRGNHDAQSQITRHLDLPPNVRELGHRRPETVVYEDLGLAVHGQSFGRRDVDEDLAARYPDAIAGLCNVGLLHTSLTGREGHEPYAPTRADILAARGYDYWALGHVHRHEVVSREPWIVYPGNLQGRHFRETGPKGAMVIAVDDGRVTSATLRALDVVRWCVCQVDVSAAQSGYDAVELVREALEAEVALSEQRTLAARIELRGRSAAHAALLHDPIAWENQIRVDAGGAGDVWIERVIFASEAQLDLAELRARDDAVGQVARSLGAWRSEDAALEPLMEALAELHRKLPRELRERSDGLRLDDPATVRELLGDVEQLLLARLVGSKTT
jgi:DNA repair exonuclease SbcCD nuclease subunit